VNAGPAGDPDAPPLPSSELAWIEPCRNTWLGGSAGDPALSVELRQSVPLAFIAALQLLTSQQRALLLLRDVVELTTDEAAAALEMTVSASKSLLHRARSAIGQRSPIADDEAIDAELLERYVRAWESADPTAMVALLHEEVVLAMPPSPTWFAGRAATVGFIRGYVVPRARRQPLRLIRTGENGRMAFAVYRAQKGRFELEAIQLVSVRSAAIVATDHFSLPEVLGRFAARSPNYGGVSELFANAHGARRGGKGHLGGEVGRRRGACSRLTRATIRTRWPAASDFGENYA